MRIVVLGAGTVGTSIADLLCQHRHSVTLVDIDADNIRRLNAELDVRGITGSASQSSVLFQAGLIGADICLAVTGDDEVNIVAASMAKAMGVRRAISRVYAPVFRDLSTFDYQSHFGIDRMLSLEHLSAMELARGIRNPGSVVVESFSRGELEVAELKVREGSTGVGESLKTLGMPRAVRVGSINREGKMWIATADDVLQIGDRITLIGRSEDVDIVRDRFDHETEKKKGVVIAGGGETGFHLAHTLEGERFDVLLMESCPKRCEVLANSLTKTTVVHVDATRRSVLEEERVGSADVFVAATGDDENNILAGVEARDIGAKRIMALIGRPDYASIVGKLGIDLAVSPRDVMAKQVLSFLNTGAVLSRTPLPGGRLGVFEIDVLEGVPATEHVLANLPLPTSCLIAAVIHGGYVRVPGADDHLEAGDTVVALIDDSAVEETLAQFSV